MGQYEHNWFLKHFKTVERLQEFKKRFIGKGGSFNRKYCEHGDSAQDFDYDTGTAIDYKNYKEYSSTNHIRINARKIKREIKLRED